MLIKPQGTLLDSNWTCSLDSVHIFHPDEKYWVFREELFVSDETRESDYHRDHEKNFGSYRVDAIEADLTFLKHNKRIRPSHPKNGVVHFKVELVLEFRIEGMDMAWAAKFEDKTLGEGRFSVAAAFEPGAL